MSINQNRILDFLREVGVSNPKPRPDGWVNFKCIIPGHKDNKPSAGVHLESGIYNCYGCSTSTNIYKIVQIFKNCSYQEAINYINNDLYLEQDPQINLQQRYEAQQIKNKKENKKNYVLNNLIPLQPDLYEYTSVRGFTKEFCEQFNIRYCTDGYLITSKDTEYSLNGYMILPIIDNSLNLNTIEARKISGDDWKLKVMYPYGSNPNITLLNFENLDVNQDLVICEGYGSIPKIWTHITKNVTCTFGSKITKDQLELLKKFNKKKIFLSDWDPASYESLIKLRTSLKDMWVFKEKTDDKEDDFVDKLNKGYIEVSRFLVNLLYKEI